MLADLDPIVRRSSQDEQYRQELASSQKFWEKLKIVLQNVSNVGNKNAVRSTYMRCVKGLFLLMRNLSVSNQEFPQKLLLQDIVVKAFIEVIGGNFCYDEIETMLFVAATSFLYNITKEDVHFDNANMKPFDLFLRYPINHTDKNENLLLPFSLLFLNLTSNDDFLYHFLKQRGQDDILYEFFVKQVIQHHTALFSHLNTASTTDGHYELGTIDAILLKIFINSVTSGSFEPYLRDAKKDDERKFFQILKLSQLVVTSSESWNKYQLTSIMSWCFPIMQHATTAIQEYFQKSRENLDTAQRLHTELNISLDITSSLCKYEYVHQYLLSYNGLDTLISLLQVLQANLLRINFYKSSNGSIKSLKASNSKGERIIDQQYLGHRIDLTTHKIFATNFPESKSFIVEIIASLAYRNSSVKDKVRELGGLALVLSNSVIDDNDPFIKERSIICIKFLLSGNKANQDFVANLEAKKAVQDETLAEIGYEIKIGENGKVSLASKNEG